MPRQKRLFLIFMPATLLTVILLAKHYQLQISYLFAVAYLFWAYLEIAFAVLVAFTAIVFARARWPAAFVLTVLAASLISPYLSDYRKNGPATGQSLKVITYNWLGGNRDRSDIYRWIAQQQPDIMTIDEFNARDLDATTRLFPLFPYRSKLAQDNILLSKYPIIRQRITQVGSRAILYAKLDVNGSRIGVWSIHPSTLRNFPELAARNDYLAMLAEQIGSRQTEPMLMMGDFNATRWDPNFQHVVSQGKLHEEPRLLPFPTRMAVRRGLQSLGSPIDHILTNGRNKLSDCSTGPLLGSDHRPMICTLTLEQ
ncbi:endonuclease/exonuclease/phosphatase family protein [Martelella sp. HB161492]|uniref:endonuclease/exonuclease/phosphatase family protein n=1 Tax=Martelella sp. HB161492 TaxID=2720726 RepID=UPI00158FE26D|nr:endonuclease/exonuclease/phosphatase family protein [Martelella sp. HB161492]